jgi:integrase
MRFPVTVKHYALTAKIYSSKDAYHVVWRVGGKRIKQQYRRFKAAKEGALAALKMLHKGKGQVASLPARDLGRVSAALDLLTDAGHPNILTVANEFLAAKQASHGADLVDAAKFWAINRRGIERVSFQQAADDWFKTHEHRWADTTRANQSSRKGQLVKVFQIDACDLDFESLRLFFEEELECKSGKYRNHYRETLRGIIKHCIARSWMQEKHGLETLLRNEKAVSAAPQIITPGAFCRLLENADTEVLPLVALMGFCGIRFSEATRLTWEDVWGVDGYVVLNANQTKTAQRRLVDRCPTLEAWMEPYKRHTGAVWVHARHVLTQRLKPLRKAAGLTGVHNALRHSYCSYKLALTQKPEELAYQMGNTPAIIYKNYRELVTPVQGKEWFAILPQKVSGSKIIKAI